jgi:hypothetical protein
MRSQLFDEPINALVDSSKRVFAENGSLRLIVHFEVHPVDGDVTTSFSGTADEFASQSSSG